MTDYLLIVIAWLCNVPSLLVVWLLARNGASQAVIAVFGAMLTVNLTMALFCWVAVGHLSSYADYRNRPKWLLKVTQPTTGISGIMSWLGAAVIGAYSFAELMTMWQSWPWGATFGLGLPLGLVVIPVAVCAIFFGVFFIPMFAYNYIKNALGWERTAK